jgi:hypothetical protein
VKPPTNKPVKPPTAKPNKGPTKAPTKGYGDPHFLTWNGDKFDFHGECDLVFVKNPHFRDGLGMDIHMRTKIRRNWSFVDVATLRIGADVLEVKGGKDERYWINGVEHDATPNSSISGFPIRYQRANSKQRVFIVDIGNDQMIEIRTYKDFVGVTVNGANKEDFGESTGLTGEFGTGRKLSRDGSVIEDVNDYGQEWQVHPEDGHFFRSLEGPQFPLQQCTLPSSFESNSRNRRLGESTTKMALAEKACAGAADFDACVFDVLLTDDIEMAGAF